MFKRGVINCFFCGRRTTGGWFWSTHKNSTRCFTCIPSNVHIYLAEENQFIKDYAAELTRLLNARENKP